MIDFHTFHADLASPSQRLADAAKHARGLGPIAFAVEGLGAYTFVPEADTVAIVSGSATATTIIELREPDWEAFVTERFTRYGLLYNAPLQFAMGEFADLCRWEPVLRLVFHGRPVYEPAQQFFDRMGAPLDLTTTFTLADDPRDLAHFLQTAGFVHVRKVFNGHEVAALGHEVDRLIALARPDDVHSWWTRTSVGEPAVCQLKYGARDSAMVTDLHHDPRILALVAASGELDLTANLDRNEGTKIIIKHPGASEGLTDLPLHTDCGMGFHPIACQMVLVGVQLEPGTGRGGQLHMTAGSHVASTPDPAVVDVADWPIVALDTAPGDCTVHYSHTLHGAPAPSGGLAPNERARRTIYPCFAPPSLVAALDPYSDLVAAMQNATGVTTTVDEQLGRAAAR